MGWSEEQTLNSTMAYIETAYHGRIKMLEAIFGSPKPKTKNTDNGPSLFKDLKRLALRNQAKANTNG